MRDKSKKPTKSRDDLSVGNMVQNEETVMERPVVKGIQRQLQKALRSPEFVETESVVSEDEDEEKKSVVKRIQTLPKKVPKFPVPVKSDDSDDDEEEEPVVKNTPMSPELAEMDPEDSEDSDTGDTLRAIGFPIEDL